MRIPVVTFAINGLSDQSGQLGDLLATGGGRFKIQTCEFTSPLFRRARFARALTVRALSTPVCLGWKAGATEQIGTG